jgi:hypothetical protein
MIIFHNTESLTINEHRKITDKQKLNLFKYLISKVQHMQLSKRLDFQLLL